MQPFWKVLPRMEPIIERSSFSYESYLSAKAGNVALKSRTFRFFDGDVKNKIFTKGVNE